MLMHYKFNKPVIAFDNIWSFTKVFVHLDINKAFDDFNTIVWLFSC